MSAVELFVDGFTFLDGVDGIMLKGVDVSISRAASRSKSFSLSDMVNRPSLLHVAGRGGEQKFDVAKATEVKQLSTCIRLRIGT